MIGWIQCKTGRGRPRLQDEVLCGLQVLSAHLTVPEEPEGKRLERRIRRLEQLLQQKAVRRVILPDRFPYRRQLVFLRPVDPMILYRGTADLLMLEVLRRKGTPPAGARAALAGPRLCPELCAAAERLCALVRELRIDVPGEEGEEFARYLQDEFGVPLLPRTASVDAVVAFGETDEQADLCLWGESGIRLRAAGIELPEEIEQPMLALLWERGRVRRETLQVINLP